MLARAGATVAADGRRRSRSPGWPPSRSWRLLGEPAVPFSEVSAHRATLEEAYLELTRDAVEYRAETAAGGRAMTDDRRTGTRAQSGAGPGFGQLLRAEWTKFRTVRGWVIGMLVAAAGDRWRRAVRRAGRARLPAGRQRRHGRPGCPARRSGRAARRSPTASTSCTSRSPANGTITVRVTSLTGLLADRRDAHGRPGRDAPGLQPWAKAGIIIKASTRPGSAYAAMMVTGGHGVRMQYNYTGDTAGLPGAVVRGLAALAAADPVRRHDHRLRLRRRHALDQGRHRHAWPGLPSTVQAGLFATSPRYAQTSQLGAGRSVSGGPTPGHRRSSTTSARRRRPGGRLDRRRSRRRPAGTRRPGAGVPPGRRHGSP